MARKPGPEKQEPSLELPTLKLPGLGRRRRRSEVPDEQAAAPAAEVPSTAAGRAPQVAEQARPAEQLAPPPPVERRRRRAERPPPASTPRLPRRLAATLTGVLVGAVGAGATYAAMAGCELVRGVSTCGGAPGFLILVAILVLMVLLGALLLRAFGVRDSASTSFLGVGIVAVVVMLGLLDTIFSVWMFAVIPVLSGASYTLAHWVTTRFEGDTGRRDWT